jgi:large subunit ribosomal protein L31e
MVEERVYVVPLRRAKLAARYKRTPRAVRILREFIARHMKSENIKIDTSLNERLWSRGARKPPARIRVRAIKQDDGTVVVSLAE